MTNAFPCKHFSIRLPAATEDQSLTALFRHVSTVLAEDEPIPMDDLISISFETELGSDAEYRGTFTIVFDETPETAETAD